MPSLATQQKRPREGKRQRGESESPKWLADGAAGRSILRRCTEHNRRENGSASKSNGRMEIAGADDDFAVVVVVAAAGSSEKKASAEKEVVAEMNGKEESNSAALGSEEEEEEDGEGEEANSWIQGDHSPRNAANF